MNSNRGRNPNDFGPDEETDMQDSSSQDESRSRKPPSSRGKKSSLRHSNNVGASHGSDVAPVGKTEFLELNYNVAAALCYVPVAPAVFGILWLVTEDKTNTYLRFHAIQSIALTCLLIAVNVVIGTVGAIIRIIPVVGDGIGFILTLFGGLLSFIFMGVCFRVMYAVFKDKGGRLPIIADMADKYAEPN